MQTAAPKARRERKAAVKPWARALNGAKAKDVFFIVAQGALLFFLNLNNFYQQPYEKP